MARTRKAAEWRRERLDQCPAEGEVPQLQPPQPHVTASLPPRAGNAGRQGPIAAPGHRWVLVMQTEMLKEHLGRGSTEAGADILVQRRQDLFVRPLHDACTGRPLPSAASPS